MENCEIRKNELKDKENSLKNAILKYNSFIIVRFSLKIRNLNKMVQPNNFFHEKEADVKKVRAMYLAEDERQLQKAKDLEIQRLKEEYKNSIRIKEKISRQISKYSSFNKFMKKVILKFLMKNKYKKSFYLTNDDFQ